MSEHEMHAEWIDVSTSFIEQLINNLSNKIFCVGTTSVRTVESLYWMGVKTIQQKNILSEELEIKQWEVYEDEFNKTSISTEESLKSLLQFLQHKKIERLITRTQIIIAPGYTFKIVNGMITNFHQPKSTLLLLVAAMMGEGWKDIYGYAIQNDYRFLSYGDGCLIFNEEV